LIISIASGKGGTGKTTVATNMALAIDKGAVLLDCDVEEPNAHLFIQPEFEKTLTVSTPVPSIDMTRCTLCKKCAQVCRFKAITVVAKTVLTFPEMCHSCGGCMLICPENAVSEVGREIGVVETGAKNGLFFVHGRLRVGEAMSPPLIRKVREYIRPDGINIIDAPPGTSCPVIAAMKGADVVLLVTEPTPFGLYDLKLAAEAVKLLKIPAGLVINRADKGDDGVKTYAEKENLPVLMEIPFDRRIAEVYSTGRLLIDAFPEWKPRFVQLYERLVGIAGKERNQ
jgi:MinD superfamily P-loop ATPase